MLISAGPCVHSNGFHGRWLHRGARGDQLRQALQLLFPLPSLLAHPRVQREGIDLLLLVLTQITKRGDMARAHLSPTRQLLRDRLDRQSHADVDVELGALQQRLHLSRLEVHQVLAKFLPS